MEIKEYGEIENWFPTPVYNVVDDEDFANREVLVRECRKVISQVKKTDNATMQSRYERVLSSHAVDDTLFRRKEFSALTEFIAAHVQAFTYALGYRKHPLVLSNMWTNVSVKGNFLFPHTHPGALISGSYYVKVEKQDGLNFHDAYSENYSAGMELNEYTFQSSTYDGIEGNLIMFRGSTPHSTCPQEADERIVISFNFGKAYQQTRG